MKTGVIRLYDFDKKFLAAGYKKRKTPPCLSQKQVKKLSTTEVFMTDIAIIRAMEVFGACPLS